MKIFLPIALAVLCGGCISPASLSRLAKDLAKDHATVTFELKTLYGSGRITRTNPDTNTPPHTVSPDGTVTIGVKP